MFDEPRPAVVEWSIWHRAGRPSWDCVVCQQPWPCAPVKVELAEEFVHDRVSGTIYLAMCMHDAIDDSFHRAGPDPAKLWNRFLGWFVALWPRHTPPVARQPEPRMPRRPPTDPRTRRDPL